jgi:hypothetical protein
MKTKYKRFWRKRRTGRWRSNPHHSFEKLSKRRFQKINDCLARIRENIQTASRHYGTVLISSSSWALLWFHRRSRSYPAQWKLFLTRHHLGMLSIGCDHCGSLFCFRIQEVDGASDQNRRDQAIEGESNLGIRSEAEGGGGRERKGDTPLGQDDMQQVQ